MIKKLLVLAIIAFFAISCAQKEKSEEKEQKTEETSTNSEEKTESESSFVLDDLFQYNSHDELVDKFGSDVKKELQYPPGGGEERYVSILYPGTKNEVTFNWSDWDNSKKLYDLTINKMGTQWKTKDGLTLGLKLEKLEELNGKTFTFSGLAWDFGGYINWEKGELEKKHISGAMAFPEDNIPTKYDALLGDITLKSTDKLAREANLVLGELSIYKK